MLGNICDQALLPVLALLITALLAHPFLVSVGKSHCAMTYMYPSYIDVSRQVPSPHQVYGLFLYKEGRPFYQNTQETIQHATGVPVLFLHGSGGSYKQVRSLASETARQSEAAQAALAWYSADYKEELSAFDGLLLERQTLYAIACVKWLRTHYTDEQQRPLPLVLVGHSMGGVVVRAAAVAVEADSSLRGSILAIVTLAAPHQQPPVNIQASLHTFYSRLQRSATQTGSAGKNTKESTTPSKLGIPLLSIAGGTRDLLVLPELNALVGVWDQDMVVEADVRDMPSVWLSADHQSMVWCNELVVLLARLLLTTAHPDTIKLHNQGRAQQQILQQMQHAVQPKVADALGWVQQDASLCKTHSAGAIAGEQSSCPNTQSTVEASMHITDNQVLAAGQQAGETCKNQTGCWWTFNHASTVHQAWTLLLQGADPCNGFQVFLHPDSGTAGSASTTHTLAQTVTAMSASQTELMDVTQRAVQLLNSIKGFDGKPASSSEANTASTKQTWLLRVPARRPVSLWVSMNAELHLTAETSIPDTIRLQLWQLLSPQGQLIRSEHSTAMHLQLPWLTAYLQGLGLKLTAESIPSPGQQQHSSICWQPLLVAYAAGSSGCNQSVREVVRRTPAELLLWTTETLQKQIGVISDPSCHLRLRLQWEVQQAARNAFRLHAASLPALASALLLLRMALPMIASMIQDNSRPKRSQPSQTAKLSTAQTSANSSCIFSSCQAPTDVSRSILYCVMLTWAATASWLWPQLAVGVGWMSHRRPSLPSVTWAAFLLLLTEGLLEACEGVASSMGRCGHMIACACKGSQAKSGHIPIPVQQHPWRRAGVFVLTVVATLALARVQPMLALLQAMLCHIWLACMAKAQTCAAPRPPLSQMPSSADPCLCRPVGSVRHKAQHMLPVQKQQQQQPATSQQQVHVQQMPLQVQQEQQQLHLNDHQQVQGSQQQEERQHVHVHEQQQVHACQLKVSQQHCQQGQQQLQPYQHLLHTEQGAPAHLPSPHQTAVSQKPCGLQDCWVYDGVQHATYIKLLICCILLEALPFVAWGMQPRGSQQPAAWIDALPHAVLATHAAMLATLGNSNSAIKLGTSQQQDAHKGMLHCGQWFVGCIFAVASVIAVSALHGQPFRAIGGTALVCMLEAVLRWRLTSSPMAQMCKSRNLRD